MIDIESGVIEFDLDCPIDIYKDGDMVPVTEIKFKQPSRKTAPLFENLVSMFSAANQDVFSILGKIDPEGAEDQKRTAKSKAEEKQESTEKDVEEITMESIMTEARSHMGFVNNLKFDFVDAYKIFEKMLLQNSKFAICWVGGIPLTDSYLDRIDYRDFKLMLFVYISFFGRPVQSATGHESEQPSKSHTPAKEL